MTINYATGEIVEFDTAAAERRAERIVTRLDAIAENYTRVLPMIREAIEKRDDLALGYRSPGEYVSDRFGQSLAGLGLEVRRAVVGELTEAGLSTRAIAPVVGVSQKTVDRDVRAAGESHDSPADFPKFADHMATFETPEPTAGGEAVAGSGQTPEGASFPSRPDVHATDEGEPEAAPARPPVTGIDGKTYSRPGPKEPAHADAEYDNAVQACLGLTRAMSRLLSFEHQNMRDGMRAYWSVAADEVPPIQRRDVTPEHMRAAARGLLELADEWESQ